ncbi:MAG TPA: VOC family protein [Longimicrobiaceae bacterium]
MKINAYLFFDGQCAEAFRFYERVLGGKIEMMMTNAESPMRDQVPPEALNQVIHVSMSVGDQLLMGSDAPPPHFEKPQGFSVSVGVEKASDAERIFAGLSEGGQVRMPMEKTFWAPRFGMCVDRFGIPWMVGCEKED